MAGVEIGGAAGVVVRIVRSCGDCRGIGTVAVYGPEEVVVWRAGVCATMAAFGGCGVNRRKLTSNLPSQNPTMITTTPIISGISEGLELSLLRDAGAGRLGRRLTTGVRGAAGAGSSWR